MGTWIIAYIEEAIVNMSDCRNVYGTIDSQRARNAFACTMYLGRQPAYLPSNIMESHEIVINLLAMHTNALGACFAYYI